MSKNPSKAKKHLAFLLLFILISVIFLLGWVPNNGSAQYALIEGNPNRTNINYAFPNRAVPGTPEFAMSEITRAVQEQNGELFLQYVDLDGILAEVAKKIPGIQAAEVKQQIMAEITSGKAKLSARPDAPVMFLFDEWFVGGVSPRTNAVLALGMLDLPGENGIAWLTVKVFNARTPAGTDVKFPLRKEGSEYKVHANGFTTAGLVSIQKEQASATQGLQRDYSSIRKEWERIVQYEIQAGQARIDQKFRNKDAKNLVAECWPKTSLTQCTNLSGKTANPSVTILLKNVHDKAIQRIEFKVLFYEMDGEKRKYRGQTYAKIVSSKNFPLAPGESRVIKLELESTSIFAHYYLSSGAYRGEVLPDNIMLVGGQTIVDNGSGSLQYPLTMEHKFYLFFFGLYVLVVIIAFARFRASNPQNRSPKSQEPQPQGDPAAQPEILQPSTRSWLKDLLKALLVGLGITGAVVVSSPILILLLHILIGSH